MEGSDNTDSPLVDHKIKPIIMAIAELESQGVPESHPQYQLLVKLLRAQVKSQGKFDISKHMETESSEESTSPSPSTPKPLSSSSTSPQLKSEEDSKSTFSQEFISKINSRIKALESLLPLFSDNDAMKLKIILSIRKLRVLPIQREVRASLFPEINKLLHLHSGRDLSTIFKHTIRHPLIPEATGVGDKVEPLRREERFFLAKEKSPEWLQAVLSHSRVYHAFYTKRAIKKNKFYKTILKYHSDKERKESIAKERLEKDRMAALRRNDETEYRKLLEQTKNKRLRLLVDQTDQYLEQIGEKVIQQQEASLGIVPVAEPTAEVSQPATSDGTDESKPSDAPPPTTEARKPYYTRIHRIQETIETQPSILVGGQLKEYQMDGLTWLLSLFNNRLNGILADEMGLGKTIQTIALICQLVERKGVPGPFLVVVPLSTISNWALEFKKWAPSLAVVLYKGLPPARKKIYQTSIAAGSPPFHVCLTTFDYVIKDRSSLTKLKWVYIIVDEGHRMKNHNCKLSTTLAKHYESEFRVILTGTPLQNSLPELWSLLNFLLPTIFNSVDNFEQWFNKPFANTGEKLEMNEEETLLVIQRLHKVLRPFLLRRLKTQVEAQLPEKVERVIKIEMSAWQRRMYDMAKQGVLVESSKSAKGVVNSLIQLRQICDHPFILQDVEMNGDMDLLWRVSGKFEFLDRIMPKFQATNHRILMFSQFTSALDTIEVYLTYRGYLYLRLDGNTKAEDRGDLLAKFNEPNSPYFIFILSTRAGGLGLNLQTADTVILFDSDWNPQADLQAQDRAHRIGQKNDVLVLRLVTINSIEEKILESANFKRDLDSKIIQAGMFNKNSTSQDRRQFLMSLLKDDQEDDQDVSDVPDNKQVNQLISRSDEEYKIFQMMDKERLEVDRAAWDAAGHVGQPLPSRLIQEDELPDYMLADVIKEREVAEAAKLVEYGRGMRRHELVNEEMTEEEFMKLVTVQEDLEDERDEEEPGGGGRRGPNKNGSDSTSNNNMEDESTENLLSLLDDTESSTLSLVESKKKRSHSTPFSLVSQQNNELLSMWRTVRNAKTEDGESLAFPFVDLPTEDIAPGYYNHITRPMALNIIKQKFATYKNDLDFYNDMMQIWENACTYNREGSPIYLDAQKLKSIFTSSWNQYIENKKLKETTSTKAEGEGELAKSLEPPRKFIISFNSKPIPKTSVSATPSTTSTMAPPNVKQYMLKLASKSQNTSDSDEDDGFAESDLKGTGMDTDTILEI